MTPYDLPGYEELNHTADISIKVWAASMEELFNYALKGMYALLDIKGNHKDKGVKRKIILTGVDYEDLLISFLSEFNYRAQMEHLFSEIIELSIDQRILQAKVLEKRILKIPKEIKAVTYHNLRIQHTKNGYSVIIVFDV